MREILFKAKQTNNAQWVEGYFFKDGEKNCYIQQGDTGLYYLVNPVTVCEFTGFYDTSVRRIFENDILSVATTSDNGVEKREYIVYFGKSGQWYTVSNDADRDNVLLSTLLHKQAIFLKVTGNTFDEAEKMAHEWLMNFSDKHKLHSAK